MNMLLRQARLAAGKTQEEVAEALGTSTVSLWRWENGQTPSRFFRDALCTYFGMSSRELGWERPVAKRSTARTTCLLDPALPSLRTPVFGRSSLLAHIQDHLSHSQSHVLGLVGLPGSGKTALLSALADHDLPGYAAVLFAALGEQVDLFAHVQRWALFCTGTIPQSLQEALTLFQCTLVGQRLLFLFDDVRHQEDVLPFLALLRPQDRVIFTTRLHGLAYALCPQVWQMPELNETDAYGILTTDLPPSLLAAHRSDLHTLVQGARRLPLALVLLRNILRRCWSTHAHQSVLHTLKCLVTQELCFSASAQPCSNEEKERCPLYQGIRELDRTLPTSVHREWYLLAQTFGTTAFHEREAHLLFSQPFVALLDCLREHGLLEWSEEHGYSFHPVVAAYAHLQQEPVSEVSAERVSLMTKPCQER